MCTIHVMGAQMCPLQDKRKSLMRNWEDVGGPTPPPPSKLPSSSNGARCFRCAVQSSRLFSMVHVYVTSPSTPHNEHQRFENVSDRRQRMAPKGERCFGTTLMCFTEAGRTLETSATKGRSVWHRLPAKSRRRDICTH